MRLLALRLAMCLVLVTAWTGIARAQDGTDRWQVTQTMDFFVVVSEPIFFAAETDLCEGTEAFWCANPPFTDSVLWLYDEQGGLMAVNDDDPRKNGQSYNSYLGVQLQPGVYRLRAGRFFCINGQGCLHPDLPFPEGGRYELISSLPLVLDPTPPQASIPPIPSELPSPEPSPEPSPDPSPEPSVEPSPTETPESPSPSVSVAPSPLPEPSLEPSPTPEPTPEATPTPTATPTPEPSSLPVESTSPSPSPTEQPSPSEEPSQTPVPPSPTPEPPSNPAEAAVAVVGEAVAAVAESVAEAAQFVADLGKDITPAERKEASKAILPAIIIGQVTQTIAAAAAAASAAATSTAMRARSNK